MLELAGLGTFKTFWLKIKPLAKGFLFTRSPFVLVNKKSTRECFKNRADFELFYRDTRPSDLTK
jgi:hypothetical protein